MKKEKIVEGNLIIAKFMGLEIITDGISFFDTSYKLLKNYNSSWGSLMPVLEKIETIEEEKGCHYNVVIGFRTYCGISESKGMLGNVQRWESSHTVNEPDKTYTWKPETKIEAVWIAVVKFLTWKNEQNENTRK